MYFFLILVKIIKGDTMLEQALQVVLRSLISLTVLFFVTKLIGRKQVSELSLFDYTIGISIGNFAAESTMNFDISFIHGIVAVATYGIVAYLVSIVTMKSILLRRLFIGAPIVVIENGKILERSMKKLRIDINDLLEQVRNAGYFDLSTVEYALMEPNGKLSILLKSEYQPVINKDMNIKLDKACLCTNVMIDGVIMSKNLNCIGKDETWLIHELKVKGYKTYNKIILVTVDNNEKLTVYEKNASKKPLQLLE